MLCNDGGRYGWEMGDLEFVLRRVLPIYSMPIIPKNTVTQFRVVFLAIGAEC